MVEPALFIGFVNIACSGRDRRHDEIDQAYYGRERVPVYTAGDILPLYL